MLFDQALRRSIRKVQKQAGDNVAPCLLSPCEMESFDGFFSRLVRREASPVVTPVIP